MTRLTTLFFALFLVACGDKDGDDTGSPGSGMDGGASADGGSAADGGSTGDGGADADLAGCLDEPCNLPAVGAFAWDLCSSTTSSASDTMVAWGETRYQSGQGASGIVLTCQSASLAEGDCPGMCEAAGLDNPYYNSASKDCSCLSNLDAEADLAARMIALVCSNGTADANVGAYNLTPGAGDAYLVASVTCRDGASQGSEACQDMMALVNSELGTSFGTATDYGAGCSVSP